MGFWNHMKGVGKVVAPIVATTFGGPLAGKITAGVMGSLLKGDKQKDMYLNWMKYAQALETDGNNTNDMRKTLLSLRIRRDMLRHDGKEPKDRIVNWTAEGLLLEIKGDFGDG